MTQDETFAPQRHEVLGASLPPGMETVGDHDRAMVDLANEIHLDVAARRAMAAGLAGLGWRETPHLAQHLAWLLERETDALTAYSLYRAVLSTHPQHWKLGEWQQQVLRTTPFPLLRAAILRDLMLKGSLHAEPAEEEALLTLLDPAEPEHRALAAEHRWFGGSEVGRDVDEVVAMLQPQASMAEKVAGMRVVHFASDPQLDERALPALLALFRAERHSGLSLTIADTLVRKRHHQIDLDFAAYLIRAWHGDGIPAAEVAMRSMLYSVEGFLMDSFALGEESPSALTGALFAAFSPAHLPADANAVIDVMLVIACDTEQPLAAFAATAVLAAKRHPNPAGLQALLEAARSHPDSRIRAYALRVLCSQSRALLPMLDELKKLAVAPDTAPRVRRAAFHALLNTHQSGLPRNVEEIIDLYFQYLRDAPFDHFGDALGSSDAAQAPRYFLMRFAESLDKISTESARQAAFQLVQNPFGFGLSDEFKPYWAQIVRLMLRALNEPRHDQLHYTFFWNMLHNVPVPAREAADFAAGLRELMARVDYTEQTRSLIERWLELQ